MRGACVCFGHVCDMPAAFLILIKLENPPKDPASWRAWCLSYTKASSGEFKYNKGTEIFGEAEPADYIYQVIEGAVRSHKLLSDGRRQIGAFHLAGDILVSKMAIYIVSRPKPSLILLFAS
jgi:Cyclic nucleotide-binding domain